MDSEEETEEESEEETEEESEEETEESDSDSEGEAPPLVHVPEWGALGAGDDGGGVDLGSEDVPSSELAGDQCRAPKTPNQGVLCKLVCANFAVPGFVQRRFRIAAAVSGVSSNYRHWSSAALPSNFIRHSNRNAERVLANQQVSALAAGVSGVGSGGSAGTRCDQTGSGVWLPRAPLPAIPKATRRIVFLSIYVQCCRPPSIPNVSHCPSSPVVLHAGLSLAPSPGFRPSCSCSSAPLLR